MAKAKFERIKPHANIGSSRQVHARRADFAKIAPIILAHQEKSSPGQLDEIVKFRLDRDLLLDLNRILAYSRGRGYSTTLSDLMRDAAKNYRDGVLESIPEINAIRLPEEDHLPARE